MKKIISTLIGTLNIVYAETVPGEFADDFYDITTDCVLEETDNNGYKEGYITETDGHDMNTKAILPDIARAYSGFDVNPFTKKISAWATTAAPIEYEVSARGDMSKNFRYYNGAASTKGYGIVSSSTPFIKYRKRNVYEFK